MRTLFVFLLSLACLLPSSVNAAEACRCFCGSASLGAIEASTEEHSAACQTTCSTANYQGTTGLQYVGCYTEEAQYPAKSDVCWTDAECTRDNAANDWEDGVAECDDQGPYPMGHCYAAPRTVSVMTAINGETEFTGIGDYVSALYQFLIPAMAIVAVVMIMIAGLQYILARGSANAIKLAKQRMANAVIGFVLLMSAYALANLLDPSLTHIKQLRIPMVKQVIMLDPDSTCEYLASIGYGVNNTTGVIAGRCGTKGTITSTELVDPQVITGVWEVDDECTYSTCMDEEAGESCVRDEGEYTCVSCSEIYDGGDLAPSTAACAEASHEQNPGTVTGNKTRCAYVTDTSGWSNARSDSVVTIDQLEGGSCAMVGTNSSTINCTQMRSGTGGGSCRDYDDLTLYVAGTRIASIENSSWKRETLEYFEDLCTDDPCGLAGSGHTCTFAQPSEFSAGNMTAGKLNCIRDDQALEPFWSGDVFWTEPIAPCYGRTGGTEVSCN